MAKSDYSKDLFKQVQELMLKCDNLSSQGKTEEAEIEFRKYIEIDKDRTPLVP